jgi:hypothetical protein
MSAIRCRSTGPPVTLAAHGLDSCVQRKAADGVPRFSTAALSLPAGTVTSWPIHPRVKAGATGPCAKLRRCGNVWTGPLVSLRGLAGAGQSTCITPPIDGWSENTKITRQRRWVELCNCLGDSNENCVENLPAIKRGGGGTWGCLKDTHQP